MRGQTRSEREAPLFAAVGLGGQLEHCVQRHVEVRNLLGERVFETVIPRSTKLAEAPSFGKPIIHYDKYSASAVAYEVLAEEVMKRLGL